MKTRFPAFAALLLALSCSHPIYNPVISAAYKAGHTLDGKAIAAFGFTTPAASGIISERRTRSPSPCLRDGCHGAKADDRPDGRERESRLGAARGTSRSRWIIRLRRSIPRRKPTR